MKIIIHVGMHKTGSSSLQQTYFENYDILVNNGVLFPKSCFKQLAEYGGKENTTCGHEFLVEAIYKSEERKNIVLAALRSEIELTKPSIVFLSAENLTHPLGGDLSEKLYAMLKIISDDLEVVVTLREPFSWLDSYYREVVSNGWGFEMRKFESYLKQYFNTMLFGNVIRSYCDSFGDDNVSVVVYGPAIFKDGIENVFCSLFFQRCIEFEKSKALTNQSAPDIMVETLRVFNGKVLPTEAARKAIISTPFVSDATGRKILFTEDQIERYSGMVRDNMLAIDRKLFVYGELEQLLEFPSPRDSNLIEIDKRYLEVLIKSYRSWASDISVKVKIISWLRKVVSKSGRRFQIKFRKLWMAKV